MVIKSVAINAYQQAMGQKAKAIQDKVAGSLAKTQTHDQGFNNILKDSLAKVNDLEIQKDHMVEEFASGKNQNVHELMISMQKAGLAMSMTGAVRSKIMTSYQEIMRLSF